MSIKISVIIPSYKPENYLGQCLKSLSKQTLSTEDFEVILVLNGPQNPYEDKITDLVRLYNIRNLRYFYSQQQGVSIARNVALDMAKGEYITFVDDDDYVSENFLEEMLAVSKLDVIGLCNVQGFVDGTNEKRHFRLEEAYCQLCNNGIQPFRKARKYLSGPWMKLIHRDILGDRRFNINFKNGEDSLYMFEVSDRMKNVACTSEKAIYYRRFRENSAMSSQSASMILNNRLKMLREYTKIYLKAPTHYSFFFYLTRILALCHTIIREGILRKGEK